MQLINTMIMTIIIIIISIITIITMIMIIIIRSTPDESEGDITSKPSKQSALCVYSLKSIRR